MEKQQRSSGTESCRRLLTLVSQTAIIIYSFFILTINASAQTGINSIKNLTAKSENLYGVNENQFYVNDEVKFSLIIPDTQSTHVNYNFNELKAKFKEEQNLSEKEIHIPFSAYKKEDYFGSTRIEFYLIFTVPGIYEFFPQTIYINGKENSFQIDTVFVTENIMEKTPRCVLQFTGGTNVDGQKIYLDEKIPVITADAFEEIHFSVFAQYAKTFSDFSFKIPTDSLFEEKTEPADFQISEPDSQLRKIADFTWTILKEEEINFPEMEITLTDFTDSQIRILFPDIKIVSRTKNKTHQKENENSRTELFQKIDLDDAFLENKTEQEKETFSTEDSDFYIEKNQKRKNILNILIFIFIALFAFSIIAQILCKKRGRKLNLFFAVSSILFLTAVIFLFTKKSEKNAIFLGGVIYSVPEENASPSAELAEGTVIKIKNYGEVWTKIYFENSEGWVKSESIRKL